MAQCMASWMRGKEGGALQGRHSGRELVHPGALVGCDTVRGWLGVVVVRQGAIRLVGEGVGTIVSLPQVVHRRGGHGAGCTILAAARLIFQLLL